MSLHVWTGSGFKNHDRTVTSPNPESSERQTRKQPGAHLNFLQPRISVWPETRVFAFILDFVLTSFRAPPFVLIQQFRPTRHAEPRWQPFVWHYLHVTRWVRPSRRRERVGQNFKKIRLTLEPGQSFRMWPNGKTESENMKHMIQTLGAVAAAGLLAGCCTTAKTTYHCNLTGNDMTACCCTKKEGKLFCNEAQKFDDPCCCTTKGNTM